MKNLLLASALSAAVGATAAVVGPMHYAVTKPMSYRVALPYNPQSPGWNTVSAGTMSMDFTVTDVVVGGPFAGHIDILMNSAPVFTCPALPYNGLPGTAHLTTGFLLHQGATVDVRAFGAGNTSFDTVVTLVGYVQ